MLIEKSVGLTVGYEYDIRPGDVFKDPMKGWEIHIRAILDDHNVLVWREYNSQQKHLPLAERTDCLNVETAESLVRYNWGPLRGGRYEKNEHGTYETLDAVWVPPSFPVSVKVGAVGCPTPYGWEYMPTKPDLVALAPLDELVRELAKPWVSL